ncbi:MAG: DNA-3-methyladenine glycosylase I [Arenimonas sp.]|nr:DNA-3-methyladenine glycosylase I [Arenimonas sp.]
MSPEFTALKQNRCPWCGTDPLYVAYHDKEWGVPVHDDRVLFEFIILEGAQAGLSWITILRKRENYRKALNNFNMQRMALYTEDDLLRLMDNPGIVRNRLKVESFVKNAVGALNIIAQFGSLDAYFWSYVNNTPIKNSPQSMADIPTRSDISDALSKDLKKRGFNFVGSTIMYAFMQAVGMVDDHISTCCKH